MSAASLLITALSAFAQLDGGAYLYTKPDPSAGGGIKGKVLGAPQQIQSVFALPPDDPKFVYVGRVTGESRNEFEFAGLPAAKYDIVLVYKDFFCEGLTLNREENTLTDNDKKLIKYVIDASEPFFSRKVIHRLSGITGDGNKSRCICGFLRDHAPNAGRYALKLVLTEDVGPAWQVTRTRELGHTFVNPPTEVLRHIYWDKLGGIRVTESVKDIGAITIPMNSVKGK